jgi:hypothetical protein
MRNPLNIPEEDRPISIVNEGDVELPFVILDVHGTKRARFLVREDAQAFGDAINFPEPELMQKDMRDTGVWRVQKKRAKPKGRTMPRGIPKKKKGRVAKKAASVKKTVQKTMKRRKKRRA